ncbi:Synaptotagmin-11 [Trichinella britovi]|uniref:Synaptotagmin-11 n=1 Tax=Trichinella britovi TaxID=45882 RepID=A0A0V1CHF2_TRIBR|nr:Synaptotagmin-11 [Trichinella britovi]
MISTRSRSFAEFSKSDKFRDSNLLTTGLCVGAVLLVGVVAVTACFASRRRHRHRYSYLSPMKEPRETVRPNEVKPVISLKNAAGPGGLKKSPSPMQSPESVDSEKQHQSASGGDNVGDEESKIQRHQQAKQNCEQGGIGEDDADEQQSLTAQKSRAVAQWNGKADNSCGMLHFTLAYSFEKNALTVQICNAYGLPTRRGAFTGGKQLVDAYVKLQLLPDKQHKIKTRVVRNTCSPVYDEEFIFYGINYNQLQNTTLHFAVVAFDRYLRDEIIGEAICPLNELELRQSKQTVEMEVELVSHNWKFQTVESRGEILISISYYPSTNKINTAVLKAQNLPAFSFTGVADPYVKVYLLYNGKKIAKKKTHVKKKTIAPVYNQSFSFDLPDVSDFNIDNISIEFLVMDWDRIAKNEVMGRCEIGLRAATHDGRSHWEEISGSPGKQFAKWHHLQK